MKTYTQLIQPSATISDLHAPENGSYSNRDFQGGTCS